MGSKYKRKLEREWVGKPLSKIKIKTLQIQADRNISELCRGKLCRRRYR
jgi:hypothetical protein